MSSVQIRPPRVRAPSLSTMSGSAEEIPVVFRSAGQQIVGIWHRPDGEGPFPAVVFLHGFTGNKAESHRIFVQQARRLARIGIASLRFDFRGSGDSEGEFRDMTISGEIADARAAFSWVVSRQDADPNRLGLLGMSLGGLVAAFAAAERQDLRALVLWNPVADAAAARERRRTATSDAELREFGVVNNAGYAVGLNFLAELDRLDPVSALAPTQVPVLIVNGTADDVVPPSDSRAYRDALSAKGARCRLHEIHGADHTFTAFPWTEECLTVTTDWFRQWLLPTESRGAQ